MNWPLVGSSEPLVQPDPPALLEGDARLLFCRQLVLMYLLSSTPVKFVLRKCSWFHELPLQFLSTCS